jgi:hypothetical protein
VVERAEHVDALAVERGRERQVEQDDPHLDEEVDPGGDRPPDRAAGVVIAEFEGGRIHSFRQCWDEADLLEGLGLLPV